MRLTEVPQKQIRLRRVSPTSWESTRLLTKFQQLFLLRFPLNKENFPSCYLTQKMSRTFTRRPPTPSAKAKNKSSCLSAPSIVLEIGLWAWGVDGRLISQTYSCRPAPHLPTGIAAFPFTDNYEWFSPPHLSSSVPSLLCAVGIEQRRN